MHFYTFHCIYQEPAAHNTATAQVSNHLLDKVAYGQLLQQELEIQDLFTAWFMHFFPLKSTGVMNLDIFVHLRQACRTYVPTYMQDNHCWHNGSVSRSGYETARWGLCWQFHPWNSVLLQKAAVIPLPSVLPDSVSPDDPRWRGTWLCCLKLPVCSLQQEDGIGIRSPESIHLASHPQMHGVCCETGAYGRAAVGFSSHAYHCQVMCVASVKEVFVMELKTKFQLNSPDLCRVVLFHI